MVVYFDNNFEGQAPSQKLCTKTIFNFFCSAQLSIMNRRKTFHYKRYKYCDSRILKFSNFQQKDITCSKGLKNIFHVDTSSSATIRPHILLKLLYKTLLFPQYTTFVPYGTIMYQGLKISGVQLSMEQQNLLFSAYHKIFCLNAH